VTVTRSRPDRDQPDLPRRLLEARELADALALTFDLLLGPAGVERALLLVERDGWLRCAARTWADEEREEVAVPLEEGGPLVDAYRKEDAEVVVLGGELQPLSLERVAVLRLLQRGQPFGLLLLDPPPADPERVRAELLPVAPLFGWLAELRDLRELRERDGQEMKLLRGILDSLPDPVFLTDRDNAVLFENRRASALFSSSERDSEGRRHAVEINNLLFSSFLTRALLGSREAARELNLVDPIEGADLLFEVLTTPVATPREPDGVTASILRDVTDLKRATTELERHFQRIRRAELDVRKERDRLNLILENVGDPILVTDQQANIILMNREAERLFEVPGGARLEERRSRHVRENDTRFSSFISDFALSSDATRAAQLNLRDPASGRTFPAEVVSGKILNERMEMTAIVSVLHDLTKAVENERLATELAKLNEGLADRVKAATAQLEEHNRQLQWQSEELSRAYRLKSQFLASMSHELRTPVNALIGYTALMRDRIYGELTAKQDHALERMYVASRHLLDLVNDVLDLARIEAGKMPVSLEPVNPELLLREVADTVEPLLRQKKLAFEMDIADDLPLLETDRTKVRQVVLNLLSNAVKFTSEGSVTLHARPLASGIEVSVADTGIGIPAQNLATVFEDFRQLDQSPTREYGGTGLGLSISRKLLHLLGGTIAVESCPGEGSTFRVWLPRVSVPAPGSTTVERSGAGPQSAEDG
jgi:PAS domain S-box-containing protein